MKVLKLCCVMITACLGVWTQRTAGQGPGAEVVTAAEGQTAALTAPVTADILAFAWYRGAALLDTQLILSYIVYSSKQNNGPRYTGLETPLPDGSLRIRELMTSYSGEYTVSVTDSNGRPTTATRRLRVCACLGVWTPETAGLGPGAKVVTAAEGQTVALPAPPTRDILVFSWYRGAAVLDTQLILSYVVSTSAQTSGPQYTCLETPLPDGSLSIRELRTSYCGDYTVNVIDYGGKPTTATRRLRVCACPGVWTQRAAGQGPGAEVVTAAEGQTVTLTAPVTMNILVFSWYRGTAVLDTELILSYVVSTSKQNNGPRYTGLETPLPDGSLRIRELTTSYSRDYTVNVIDYGGKPTTATRRLRVYGRPHGGIQCGAQSISDSHVELSCSWPGGSPPAEVRLQLPPSIDDGANNEVKRNVPRSDITPHMTLTCRGAQEGYIDNCSLALGLPQDPGFKDNTTSSVTGGEPVVLVVNLVSRSRVSSEGVLPATFTWFNGTSTIPSGGRVAVTSNASFSQMVIANAMESDSRDYVCRAENLMGVTSFSFRVHVFPAPGSDAQKQDA